MAIIAPSTSNTLYLSSLANVIKDKYNTDIPKLIPMQIFLWDYFKPQLVTFEGERRFNVMMQTALNESAGATAEMVALPDGRVPSFVQGYLYLKKMIARMVISKESIVLTQGANALVKGLPNLMDSTIKPWMLNLEAFMHQDGSSYLASSTAEDSSQLVTVDSTRFIRVGMVLDGYDASNNHDADGVVVTAINSDTTFTVTGTITSVDSNTRWYTEGSWVTSGSQTISGIYAPQGIETIVDESDPNYGDFQGLDRATYDYASAIVRDMSDAGGSAGTAGALTKMRIVHLLDSVWKSNAHAVPHFGYTSLGGFNALAQVYENANQPTQLMPAKDGLPSGLEFQYHGKAIPIVSSPNAKPKAMFFLNKDYLFRYSIGDPKWDDEGGFLRPLEDYHAFQAIYSGYMNFGTTLPQANGRLNDITEITY
jgi:hypothetical protein